MGEDVKWALGIAVTALVLVAFLPLVLVVLVPGRGRLGGASETETPRWRGRPGRPFFVRAS